MKRAASEGDHEVTIGEVYQAMLSQREWFAERVDSLEASVRADVGQVREDLVSIQVSVAGLPCKQHGDDLVAVKSDVKDLHRSVNLAKALAGVPAALSALVAAAIAVLGISATRSP